MPDQQSDDEITRMSEVDTHPAVHQATEVGEEQVLRALDGASATESEQRQQL